MRCIYGIFGLRKSRYEGEFAPELLDAIDDFSHKGNPEWLAEKLEKHKKDPDIEKVELIRIRFEEKYLNDAFKDHGIGGEIEKVNLDEEGNPIWI